MKQRTRQIPGSQVEKTFLPHHRRLLLKSIQQLLVLPLSNWLPRRCQKALAGTAVVHVDLMVSYGVGHASLWWITKVVDLVAHSDHSLAASAPIWTMGDLGQRRADFWPAFCGWRGNTQVGASQTKIGMRLSYSSSDSLSVPLLTGDTITVMRQLEDLAALDIVDRVASHPLTRFT